MTKKSWQKYEKIENMKRFKDLFIIFKDLSMKQITQIILEGENPTLKYIYIFFSIVHTLPPTNSFPPKCGTRNHLDNYQQLLPKQRSLFRPVVYQDWKIYFLQRIEHF